MPFNDPIDPATPGDSSLASEGDDRIRELKRAINERMPEVIDGWPDGDLKLRTNKLNEGVATLVSGPDADRPAVPASTFYFAPDTSKLYVAVGQSWMVIATGEGTAQPPIITDIAFNKMRRKTVSASGSISVGTLPPIAYRTHMWSGGEDGLTTDSHILLGIRFRIKPNDSSPWPTQWAWMSSYNTWGSSDVTFNGPSSSNGVIMTVNSAVLEYKSNPPFGMEHVITTRLAFYNETGGSAKDVAYELQAFFLAIS